MGGRRAAMAVATIAVATVLAGCATGEPMTDATGSTRPPFLTTSPAPPTSSPTAVSTARWEGIVADLVARGVADPPVLVSAEAVQWANGALGCPVPGSSYIQQLIDGARVVVQADGRDWDYRFDAGDVPRLCQT